MSEQAQAPATPEVAAPASPVVENSSDSASTESSGTEAQPAKPEKDWRDQRISALTRNVRERDRKLDEFRAKVAQFESQRPQQQPDPQRSQSQQVDPQRMMNEATRVAQFNVRADQVYAQGKTLPGFESGLAQLRDLGLLTADLLPTVLDAADDDPAMAAKVLNHLGSNPSEADEILSLPPLKMARAIAKLEQKLTSQPAVSNAPKPLRPERGGGTSDPPIGSRAWFDAENKRDAERRKR